MIVYVCLYMHMCKCEKNVIDITKYKQTSDDVTCNIKVEIEIDVHCDGKQAIKLQDFRHVTEYNTNK